MLPTYTRLGTTTSINRRALRTREKFLILLLCATLAFVCFGGVFYLPDNFGATDIFKKVQIAGPEIFIPAPPVIAKPIHQHGIEKSEAEQKENDDEKHILDDRNRLQQKIRDEWAAGVNAGDHLEKPQPKTGNNNEAPIMHEPSLDQNAVNQGDELGVGNAPDLQTNLPNGEDSDPVARERRNKIREVSYSSQFFLYYLFKF